MNFSAVVGSVMLRVKDGILTEKRGVGEKRGKKEKRSALCLGGWGQSIVLAQACPGQDAKLATSCSLNIPLTNNVITCAVCSLFYLALTCTDVYLIGHLQL